MFEVCHWYAQVTVDYVAMTTQGKVFDSSLEKGHPYDVRIGSGQVHAQMCVVAILPCNGTYLSGSLHCLF